MLAYVHTRSSYRVAVYLASYSGCPGFDLELTK
jgi:hypothetical protein